MNIFGNQRSKQVKAQIEGLESELDRLNDSLFKVKNDLSELKQKKKMEDEDIKHLVKLKESKLEIEFSKKEFELQKQQQEAIAEVKDAATSRNRCCKSRLSKARNDMPRFCHACRILFESQG